MINRDSQTGFVIALAWPETCCKEAGSWYDPLMRRLGINRNNYYRAGHAALVLIDSAARRCHYFDFGRYHSPYKYGRARSAGTDHDLHMYTVPKISEDGRSILNFKEILTELQLNPSCHGEGTLYASYTGVNFNKAIKKANLFQEAGPIHYGPFIIGGSNCSRFVNSVIMAGKPSWFRRLRLRLKLSITPTPRGNVKALTDRTSLPSMRGGTPLFPVRPLGIENLQSTLSRPAKHHSIPDNAQWLSGEGAGSWFACSFSEAKLHVTRYSPDGTVECSGIYETTINNATIDKFGNFRVDYPSNCLEVWLNYQGGRVRYRNIMSRS